MNNNTFKNKKGFTLIELLLYLSLATVMLAVLGGIGINVLSSRVKAHSFEQIHYNAIFLSEIMVQKIEEAVAINDPSALLSSSVLSLEMEDPLHDPTVFDTVEGMFRMQVGENEPVILSTDDVTVSQLEFFNVQQDDSSGFVRIMMHIASGESQDNNRYNASSTFHTTVRTKITP